MYLRTKAIRNKKTGAVYRYAYAVENKWRKKRSGEGKEARQKVKSYLGRVYEFPLVQDISFFSFADVQESTKDEYLKISAAHLLVQKLTEWELARHKVEGFAIDFAEGRVHKDGKPASIAMNEGMLNTFTLRRLLTFKAKTGDAETGYQLAKAFVEAGIKVPQEVFIAVFGKVAERG